MRQINDEKVIFDGIVTGLLIFASKFYDFQFSTSLLDRPNRFELFNNAGSAEELKCRKSTTVENEKIH